MSWTTVPKPSAQTYTDVAKPTGSFDIAPGTATGLLTPFTYSTFHDIGTGWTNMAKPTDPSTNELIFNGNFNGNATGWILDDFTYSGGKITAVSSPCELFTDSPSTPGDEVLFNPNFTGSATGWDLTTFTYGTNQVDTLTGGTIQTNSSSLFNLFADRPYLLSTQGSNTTPSNLTFTIGSGSTIISTTTIGPLSGPWTTGVHFTPTQSYTNCFLKIIADSNFDGYIDGNALNFFTGDDYRFTMLPGEYEFKINIGGTLGDVETSIFGDNGIVFSQSNIPAGSGQVSYQFTTPGDTFCYLDIFCGSSFNGSLTGISLKALSNWTNINKPT